MREWLIYYIEMPSNKPKNKTVMAIDIYMACSVSAIPFLWIKSIKEVSQ